MPLKPINTPYAHLPRSNCSVSRCVHLSHLLSHIFSFLSSLSSSLFLLSSHQIIIYTCIEELQENTRQQSKRGDAQMYKDHVQHQYTSSREQVINPLISSSYLLPPSPSPSSPSLPLAFGCFSFYFSSSNLLFIY